MWYRVWGISIVLICTIQSINSATLRCYLGSIDNYIEVDLDNATVLINTSYFNVTSSTIIYALGYWGKVDGPATISILGAYFTYYPDKNICLMNWQKEANSGIVGVSYPAVVELTHELAKKYAKALLDLSEAGMSMDTLHLEGLSLGAHMCGEIGRNTAVAGKIIARITGLDPAYPEYDGPLRVEQPLGKSDAKFVDIFHTDPEHMGMDSPTGTIDYYFNYGFYKNGTNRQPGCPTGPALPFTTKALCSHNRAVEYRVAVLADPESMPTSQAGSYEAWVAANGEPNNVTYVGAINKEYSGAFYLSTNSKSPYGRGFAGLRP